MQYSSLVVQNWGEGRVCHAASARMFHPRLPPDEAELIRAVGYIEPDVWQRPFHVSDTCAWHGCGCRGRRGADDMHCELCNEPVSLHEGLAAACT